MAVTSVLSLVPSSPACGQFAEFLAAVPTEHAFKKLEKPRGRGSFVRNKDTVRTKTEREATKAIKTNFVLDKAKNLLEKMRGRKAGESGAGPSLLVCER